MTNPNNRPVPPPPEPLDGNDPLNWRTRLNLIRLAVRHMDRCTAAAVLGMLGVSTGVFALMLFLLDTPRIAEQAVLFGLGLLALFLLVGLPLAQAVAFALWRRDNGWVVGYFDATATLLVHPEDGAWALSDHVAVKRGRGLARPFRRTVFAHLVAEADRHGAAITTDTISPTLADLYAADLQGLELIEQVGRDWCGRPLYRLRREPVQVA